MAELAFLEASGAQKNWKKNVNFQKINVEIFSYYFDDLFIFFTGF